MKYSEIVYKVDGPHAGPEGKTYDWMAVRSKEEFREALENGWFNTLVEAIKPKRAREENGTYRGDDPSTPDVNEAYEQGPPTREEMKQKADELELEYPKNISSPKLLKLIEDALKEK